MKGTREVEKNYLVQVGGLWLYNEPMDGDSDIQMCFELHDCCCWFGVEDEDRARFIADRCGGKLVEVTTTTIKKFKYID